MEPYQKEYVVTGYGRCGNTGAEGLKADFLYVENGDAVSLSRAKGKIVMVNGRVSGDVYQRLVSAGAVGFISVEGSPLDEGVDLSAQPADDLSGGCSRRDRRIVGVCRGYSQDAGKI